MILRIESEGPLSYSEDGVIIPVHSFTCTMHAGRHTWEWVRLRDGTKLRVRYAIELQFEDCPEFDAL